MIESPNFTNDIIVQLQFLKTVKALQVVDLNDVFVGQREMVELPERCVILPKDLVLTVILNQVFPKIFITVRGEIHTKSRNLHQNIKLHHCE